MSLITLSSEGDRVDGSARRKDNSMSDDQAKQPSEVDAELEREIRQGRKFTAQEAMGRMIGPGTMKGGSAVPRVQEA